MKLKGLTPAECRSQALQAA
ncbi:hypothetical protein [Parendozoicomonas haliclonae]